MEGAGNPLAGAFLFHLTRSIHSVFTSQSENGSE
jgi:hypothetical protein